MARNRWATGGATALLAVALVAVASAWQAAPRISPKDHLNISVFGDESLTKQYTVDQDGTLDFPYVGRVKAAGLTARELEADLSKRLVDAKVFTSPQVTVGLEQLATKQILVSGQVRNMGPIQFAGDLSVFEAIVKAGGAQPDAADDVLVIRAIPQLGADTAAAGDVLHVSLKKLEAGDPEGNVTLDDGDRVIVQKAEMIYITGYVNSPGPYAAQPGMTMRQALALAGGISDRGSDRGIKIMRPVPGKDKPQELKNVKMTDVVKPGDTIIIRARIL
jgi:polysaccharide biosynthesis/export protein